MKELTLYAVNTENASTTWKGEVNKFEKFLPDDVWLNVTWVGNSDILEGDIPMEHKDDGTKDLDENWLREQFRNVEANLIYLHMSKEDWDLLDINDSLWGQSQPVGNVGVFYGRWNNRGTYTPSQNFDEPFNEYPEQSIGIAHEASHVLHHILNPSEKDRTHYHFYGLEDVGKKERYVRTPTPIKCFEQLNWNRLPTFGNHSNQEPVESRDPADLHPELRKRWFFLKQEWDANHDSVVKLSCTYRNKAQQMKEFREGDSNARWKESLHNYKPAYALDFFVEKDGKAVWEDGLYEEMATQAEEIGLESLHDIGDGTHLQLPMTYRDAQDGRVPELPDLKRFQYGLMSKLLKKIVNLLNKLW